MARRTTARPLPVWVGDLPVFERSWPNGFKALVLPRKHAPVVVCDLYYPVGSFDEPPGRSGLAHFVEHMLFKGTERFPKGQIDRLAFVAAGQSNAETGEDCTHYWFAFPSDRWELALAVEADRMRGASFDPAEVEAERHVIIEERGARPRHARRSARPEPSRARLHPPSLSQPDSRLARRPCASTWMTSSRFMTPITDPTARCWWSSATSIPKRHLSGSGRTSVRSLPALSPRPKPVISEPAQVGRRDFTLNEPDSVARGLFGWHTVPRGHPDGPALDVLSDLLSCGRRSRLWDALVERGRVATWVDAGQEGCAGRGNS